LYYASVNLVSQDGLKTSGVIEAKLQENQAEVKKEITTSIQTPVLMYTRYDTPFLNSSHLMMEQPLQASFTISEGAFLSGCIV